MKPTPQIAYIEGRDYYFEQKMIGLSDNFIKAVMLVKATFTAKEDALEKLRESGIDTKPFSGPVDEDLRHFIEFNKYSSEKLRGPRHEGIKGE